MQTSGTRYLEAKKIAARFFFVKRNIKVPKAFTFSYIFYRIARPLLKFYYWLFKLFNPMTAWTSPASVVIFRKLLAREMLGVEFGSGKSTTFFAKHLGKLVSIEHHEGWYNKVAEWLKERECSNVEYRLVAPDKNPAKRFPEEVKAAFPQNFAPRPGYVAYVSELLKFEDESIDFLLVDGRARTECALTGIKKLKPGGMLVLDNAERERYKPVHEAVHAWPAVFTTTGLTDTVIWFKPE